MTATITTIHAEQATTDGLSSVELCAYSGASYRQCDFWQRAGYLRPSRPPSGSGSRILYGRTEAEAARIVKALLDAGMNVQPAFGYARRIIAGEEITLAGGLLRMGRPEVSG